MQLFNRRVTPSFAVSVVALTTALGGTAIASGELTTTSNQVADPDRQHLTVRSNFKGELLGERNDGTVTRESVGRYVVRFPSLLPGPRGSAPINDCAITATGRTNSNPVNTTTISLDTIPADFNAVRIYTTKPHHDLVGEFKRQDVAFDLIAVC